MTYPNPLKKRLQNGETVFGSLLPAFTPHVAGSILDTKPDFLWLDTEHMPYGTEALDYIPVLARMRGVAPMIRVAWNDPALIKKAYDAGAVAVMVPQIDSAEEAERASAAVVVSAAHEIVTVPMVADLSLFNVPGIPNPPEGNGSIPAGLHSGGVANEDAARLM